MFLVSCFWAVCCDCQPLVIWNVLCQGSVGFCFGRRRHQSNLWLVVLAEFSFSLFMFSPKMRMKGVETVWEDLFILSFCHTAHQLCMSCCIFCVYLPLLWVLSKIAHFIFSHASVVLSEGKYNRQKLLFVCCFLFSWNKWHVFSNLLSFLRGLPARP